jgi:hypothetical protein
LCQIPHSFYNYRPCAVYAICIPHHPQYHYNVYHQPPISYYQTKKYCLYHLAFRLVMTRLVLSSVTVYLFFYPINCISISIINSIYMTVPMWTPFAEWLLVGVHIFLFRQASTKQPLWLSASVSWVFC